MEQPQPRHPTRNACARWRSIAGSNGHGIEGGEEGSRGSSSESRMPRPNITCTCPRWGVHTPAPQGADTRRPWAVIPPKWFSPRP